jgi:hypothetical protein
MDTQAALGGLGQWSAVQQVLKSYSEMQTVKHGVGPTSSILQLAKALSAVPDFSLTAYEVNARLSDVDVFPRVAPASFTSIRSEVTRRPEVIPAGAGAPWSGGPDTERELARTGRNSLSRSWCFANLPTCTCLRTKP